MVFVAFDDPYYSSLPWCDIGWVIFFFIPWRIHRAEICMLLLYIDYIPKPFNREWKKFYMGVDIVNLPIIWHLFLIMLLFFVHLVHVWIPDLSIDCFKHICPVISWDYGLNEVILPFFLKIYFLSILWFYRLRHANGRSRKHPLGQCICSFNLF